MEDKTTNIDDHEQSTEKVECDEMLAEAKEDEITHIDDQEQSTEKMEADKVPTESESVAELTENIDSLEKTITEPEQSTVASKTTPSIEITSAQEIPCEKDSKVVEKATGTEAKPEQSTVASKTTPSIEITSAQEIPCEKDSKVVEKATGTEAIPEHTLEYWYNYYKYTKKIELDREIQNHPNPEQATLEYYYNYYRYASEMETAREIAREKNSEVVEKATGTEAKPEQSTLEYDYNYYRITREMESTSAQEIPCEKDSKVVEKATGTEAKPEQSTLEYNYRITREMESSDSESDPTTSDPTTSDPTTESSPSKKQQILNKVKEYFSPKRDSKSKEKTGTQPKEGCSKSLSPSDASQLSKDNVNPEEVCISEDKEEAWISEGNEEHSRKDGKKTGMMKSIRKHLCKCLICGKEIDESPLYWSRSRSVSLIPEISDASMTGTASSSGAEVDQPQSIEMKESLTEKPSNDGTALSTDIASSSVVEVHQSQSIEMSSSLTEKPNDGTTLMTNIAPTCSGADVFPRDEPTKPSETEGSTSEEAAAGSQVSSPEEELPEVHDDKYFD